MSSRLPVQIDPIRLADEGVRLQGELSDRDMARLREFSVPGSRAAVVVVDLQFERSTQGVHRMQGTIHACIEMVCQRCLMPLPIQVTARPSLALLPSAAATVADDGETLRVTGPISLSALLEDELLLAMPMIPMHAETNCASQTKTGRAPGGRENPFAGLPALMKASLHKISSMK